MSEELKNKIDTINKSIEKIENNKSKFIFCVPDIAVPNASVYEIYFHATVMKNVGHDVIMLTEKADYAIPSWIEKVLTDLKHVPMNEASKFVVSSEDVMVIPEVFSNIMEQTKNLPCVRIGLLQSFDYMINGLIPGTSWLNFGIRNVITTSKTLKNLFENFYGEKVYNIKTYNIGIPEYFNKSKNPQKPTISIVGRNANDISKVVKLFYSKYPQFSWITFDPMLTQSKPPMPMRRIDFAKRLQENFAAVFIDRISSFGTFPLECMKSGVIPICLKPDITPEYIINRNENGEIIGTKEGIGVWTNDLYEIPVVIGQLLNMFLDDEIPEDVYTKMDEIASKYKLINAEESIIKIYSEFLNERKNELTNILNTIKENLE